MESSLPAMDQREGGEDEYLVDGAENFFPTDLHFSRNKSKSFVK